MDSLWPPAFEQLMAHHVLDIIQDLHVSLLIFPDTRRLMPDNSSLPQSFQHFIYFYICFPKFETKLDVCLLLRLNKGKSAPPPPNFLPNSSPPAS
jgi:hypothetical protein